MYRTRTCGELRLSDAGSIVTLAGWVQRSRKMGGMTFVDLRDRYGITQLVFNEEDNAELCEGANHLGREFVIQVSGKVNERFSKNPNMLFHPFVLHSGDTQQGRTNIPLRFQNEKRSAYPMETPATSVPKTAPG